ncbi:MAG TPA: hypothetical protein P5228_02455 [Bacteroidales bacterium]|nr:hypothetical protein [Bacteroidales bacterium]HRZ48560.1 hypothetical protein [Bacteroidales bacterium]
MKRNIFFAILFIVVAIASCGKDGVDGKDGIDGKDGNANVVSYILSDSIKLLWQNNAIHLLYDSTFTIPDSIRNDGIVLVYLQYGVTYPGNWYFSPGLGPLGLWQTRYSIGDNELTIHMLNPDGSAWSGGTPEAVTKIKVVLVPASKVYLLAKIKKEAGLGLTDHEIINY